MKPKELLRKPVDAIRIAPVGFALLTLSDLPAAAEACFGGPQALVEGRGTSAVMPAVIGSLAAGRLIYRQFSLRRRLEKSLQSHGFDERYWIKTARHWCDRQTGRVVCQNTGYLAEYEALLDRNKHLMEYSDIRHF